MKKEVIMLYYLTGIISFAALILAIVLWIDLIFIMRKDKK